VKALGPLATSRIDRWRQQAMKALDPLAVADRDIRALRTARADRATLSD
jgi:hypothetical protein